MSNIKSNKKIKKNKIIPVEYPKFISSILQDISTCLYVLKIKLIVYDILLLLHDDNVEEVNYKRVKTISNDVISNISSFFENINVEINKVKVIYRLKGIDDQNITRWKKTVTVNPDNAGAHYRLGLAYREKGQIDEAIREWEKAVALDPDFSHAHLQLGIAYKNVGKSEQAINSWNKTIELDPEFQEAFFHLGKAYLNQGRL